ncbi:MAG: NTP transferase domain-containing protein [Verrucomicrobiales bacterium]
MEEAIAPFAAALLAGGKSRRFGADKALLDCGGAPLWQCQLDRLSALSPARLFLSAADQVPVGAAARAEVIRDSGGAGPLAGIAACLAAAGGLPLLLLAVDMPLMSADCLRAVLRFAGPAGGAVPVEGGRLQPLAALYPAAAAEIARRRLAAGDLSATGFARELDAQSMVRRWPVPGEFPHCFANANTPEEWRALQAEARG